ncbi:MAG: ABC transporter substrate-binding protein, partial [Planctomycetota bacterium]
WDVYYPKHLLENLDPKEFTSWKFWTEPVGNGPYRYVRHVPRTMIELEANPDYYRGKPKIERLVLKFGGYPLTELMSGNVDCIDISSLEAIKLADDPRFRVYQAYPLEM